uniref:Uncharacterized protein n=1 Tax=Oryza meridionalis TaxID=40149 RepID=A0A0E0EKZ9_9ORYZ
MPSSLAAVVGARAVVGPSSHRRATVATTGSPTPTARIVASVPIPPSREQSRGGEVCRGPAASRCSCEP